MTDTERLDWLEKSQWELSVGYSLKHKSITYCLYSDPEIKVSLSVESTTLREAIDTAVLKYGDMYI